MTSSNGNIFRVTGPLCGEFTGHRWIPPHKGQRRGALMVSLISAWINGWVNNRDDGDLRCRCAHYDVTVMPPKFSRWLGRPACLQFPRAIWTVYQPISRVYINGRLIRYWNVHACPGVGNITYENIIFKLRRLHTEELLVHFISRRPRIFLA